MGSNLPLTIFRRTMATICCLFGLPGNILTIIFGIKALNHRTIHFQTKGFHLYLIEISILDTCLLLYWVIDTLISYLYEMKKIEFFSLMHISAFSCFCSYMINRLCAALCSWLITCFTFIRFIHIFRQFNTIKSNIIVLTTLIIIFSIANSYSMIVLEYNPERKYPINETIFTNNTEKNQTSFVNYSLCTIRSEYANQRRMLLLNILVAGVLNLALPSILIIIVNITMLSFIKRIYSTQARNKTRWLTDSVNYRSTRSTLVIISMTYAIFYLPYLIVYFLMIMLDDTDGTLHNAAEITYILRHVSHSVNFYAYIFTNIRFRREIALLFPFICRPCSNSENQNRFKQKKKTQVILLPKSKNQTPIL
ncbi:unnamed protein product [Rotaria magnacalcarata]|uniref:G-protein coupled receptors family 1 profile domain-containing protein n=2 Tax=Rotaria magnacalcarata TaxID=392030 RepID=A0A815J6D1_9BILA|nr:unnamed protein product [Rotaria magnacalcarata]CAF2127604.1 unnamed protein product [Rotaria magnacalcarata]CAF2129715.1 unnamed protein product [Rotaria magnacalcarata]CAF4003093.1 unnamed protein product [Rotaria magnacalcarata]CAF4004428.1 unnamed protein product [Rotaria magnacalcarata]